MISKIVFYGNKCIDNQSVWFFDQSKADALLCPLKIIKVV